MGQESIRLLSTVLVRVATDALVIFGIGCKATYRRTLKRNDCGFIATTMSSYDDIGRWQAVRSLPPVNGHPVDVISFGKIQLP